MPSAAGGTSNMKQFRIDCATAGNRASPQRFQTQDKVLWHNSVPFYLRSVLTVAQGSADQHHGSLCMMHEL